MTVRDSEIFLLRQICGVEIDAEIQVEVRTMDAMKLLVENVLGDMERAAQRRGTDGNGLWCFSCGRSGIALEKCTCDLGDSFKYKGRLFCAECRAGRRAVASHIQKLLAAKRVDRVSSIRLRLLRELRRAARDLEGQDADVADSRLLSYWLANADEFSDDGDGFRAGVLRAFRKTKFLDFAALAKALERQREEGFIRQMIRAGFR